MTDIAPSGDRSQDPLALTVGCEFVVETPQNVAAIMQVAPLPEPGLAIQTEQWETSPDHHGYIDAYGNRCERLTIASGNSRITYRAEVLIAQPHDVFEPDLPETDVGELPDEVLTYIMPSRFCLPDELGSEAWQRFGNLTPGWGRVQAIVDFVHNHLEFMPGGSNPWTTAVDAYKAGQGVCRDYAHLAITFCRALNIPARYVFGYIPTIGVPPPAEPMDFAAWFEVYLDGRWHTFDARNNVPRTGRVLVGRGRDATDVALMTSFGPVTLNGFTVTAEPPSTEEAGFGASAVLPSDRSTAQFRGRGCSRRHMAWSRAPTSGNPAVSRGLCRAVLRTTCSRLTSKRSSPGTVQEAR